MLIFPILGLFSLAGLLYAKARQDRRLEWRFKPTTSLLFVLTGLTASGEGTYTNSILLGLILGLVGDVLLIVRSERAFMAGLGVFLLGHLAYVLAFYDLVPLTEGNWLWAVLLGLIALVIGGLLRPYLGTMQAPVMAYMLVISLMVWGAITVYEQSILPQDFRRVVALGAICFYLSDLAVALDQFVKPRVQQAFWGLPLYYAGQFLLAYSIGLL
jgi:uncharacterized membrane protein YhhN